MTRSPTRVRVHPGPLAGTTRVPGDKSMGHRALLLGALTEGVCEVGGLADSADLRSTATALRALGATVDLQTTSDGGLAGSVAGPLRESLDVVDCGNSGTTLRLLAGIVAGLDALTVLTGDASLRSRPVDRIVGPLRALGADVDAAADGSRAPLVIRGPVNQPVTWDAPVASAQIKSCVLLAGQVAGVAVTVRSPLPSRDHTERLLARLGGHVVTDTSDGTETVSLEPRPLHSVRIVVAGDPSSAAFWAVAAALARTHVAVPGIGANPGRIGFVEVLRQLGISVELTPASGDREGDTEPVGDLVVAGDESPGGPGPAGGSAPVVAGQQVVAALDELPVLALAGAMTAGLEVREAAELRVKESDRIDAVERLFTALGMRLETRPDGFVVSGGQRPTGGVVEADNDHRIAMTAAVAATVATGPVEIGGFETVATSYPGFLDTLQALGGTAEVLTHGPSA